MAAGGLQEAVVASVARPNAAWLLAYRKVCRTRAAAAAFSDLMNAVVEEEAARVARDAYAVLLASASQLVVEISATPLPDTGETLWRTSLAAGAGSATTQPSRGKRQADGDQQAFDIVKETADTLGTTFEVGRLSCSSSSFFLFPIPYSLFLFIIYYSCFLFPMTYSYFALPIPVFYFLF